MFATRCEISTADLLHGALALGDQIDDLRPVFSVLHCLPVGMVGENAAGTGTVMRTATVRRYGEEAGFRTLEVLPIENGFYRFYRLLP